MYECLQFIFSSPTHYLGFLLLLIIFAEGIGGAITNNHHIRRSKTKGK